MTRSLIKWSATGHTGQRFLSDIQICMISYSNLSTLRLLWHLTAYEYEYPIERKKTRGTAQ
jgi:hypothetical protein